MALWSSTAWRRRAIVVTFQRREPRNRSLRMNQRERQPRPMVAPRTFWYESYEVLVVKSLHHFGNDNLCLFQKVIRILLNIPQDWCKPPGIQRPEEAGGFFADTIFQDIWSDCKVGEWSGRQIRTQHWAKACTTVLTSESYMIVFWK